MTDTSAWTSGVYEASDYALNDLGLVAPGSPVSAFFGHWVPAGRTFGEVHDAKVNWLPRECVPDWRANIPTMPGTYLEVVGVESNKSAEPFIKWPRDLVALASWSTRSVE